MPAEAAEKLYYWVVPVTPFQQNCTLVACPETRRACVIDPGGESDRLLQLIEREQLDVDKILLTHGHIDHVGGTADLRDRLGVPVIGPHRDDAFWIEALEMQSQRFGFAHVRAFTPDQWLEQGDRVEVGSLRLDVIHCPGHTPGHVVFFSSGARWAQVGDVLFHGSIGRTDFPRGNHADLIHSIRHKLFPLGDDVTFVPGHGPVSTFGEERRNNAFVADRNFG